MWGKKAQHVTWPKTIQIKNGLKLNECMSTIIKLTPNKQQKGLRTNWFRHNNFPSSFLVPWVWFYVCREATSNLPCGCTYFELIRLKAFQFNVFTELPIKTKTKKRNIRTFSIWFCQQYLLNLKHEREQINFAFLPKQLTKNEEKRRKKTVHQFNFVVSSVTFGYKLFRMYLKTPNDTNINAT